MRMEVLLSLSGSQRQKKKPTHHIGRCGFRVHGKAIRPCRHPDKRVATVESHGILLMQTVEAMNICFNYGNDTVTYFTLLLFNA